MRASLFLLRRQLSVEDSKALRNWLAGFKLIEKNDSYEFTFAKSSGPGGQNVNKVETKATLRMYMDKAKEWMPENIQEAMRESPYYAKSSDSLVLSSMRHRKQGDNAAECLSKLQMAIMEAANRDLTGETSEEQRQKVARYIRRDAEQTMRDKQRRKQIKETRRPYLARA